MSKLMLCPDCQSLMVRRTGKHGTFYGCIRFPACHGSTSCHQNSGKPMGRPADEATRKLRKLAHEMFDTWWKMKNCPRKRAYKVLTKVCKGDRQSHISNFYRSQCEYVINIFSKAVNHLKDRRINGRKIPKDNNEGNRS